MHTHTHKNTQTQHICPSSVSFAHDIPYKMQTRCPFTSHHFGFLPSSLPSFFPSLHLWPPVAAVTSRRRVCLSVWYSGIRFAWSPRSGTNNLFNPLIIIRGIHKFGWTLNLEPLPRAEIYLFTIFSRLLGDKRCLLLNLSTAPSLKVCGLSVQHIH